MKAVLAAFLILAAWTFHAAAAASGLEHVAVGGADYVRLGEWAEQDGLKLTWHKKDDPIELFSPANNLRFSPDSAKAQFNGVTISLALPVLNRGGVPLLSLEDAEKTLQPILSPHPSRKKVRTICLDPGHGGSDVGTTESGHYEKTYTLLLGLAVEKLLQERGFKVVMTRRTDETVKLEDRAPLAARAGADLFVCLHYNALPGAGRGVEVHYLAPAGVKSSNGGSGPGSETVLSGNASDENNVLLAYDVLKSIVTALPVEDLGLKHQHFLVLRDAKMPAILVEAGIMSDPLDASRIYSPDFRQRMARAIVDGIVAYRNSVETPKVGEIKLPGHERAQGRD